MYTRINYIIYSFFILTKFVFIPLVTSEHRSTALRRSLTARGRGTALHRLNQIAARCSHRGGESAVHQCCDSKSDEEVGFAREHCYQGFSFDALLMKNSRGEQQAVMGLQALDYFVTALEEEKTVKNRLQIIL